MRVCAIVVHFLIPSPGVRDRTGQAAFLRSARAGPSAKAGWRQVKVSSTFSKVVGFGGRYVPVGRCSAADRAGRRDQTPRPYRGAGVLVPGGHRSGPVYVATSVGAGRLPLADSTRGGSRDPQPPPSHTPKKGGRMSPSWGGTAPGVFACGRGGQGASATAPAATAFGVCAACAAFFPPAAPVKAVERCSTPRKPLKRLERNFYAASRGDSLKNCLYQIKKAYTVHTRRLLSALPFLWSSSSFISFSVWKNFWAFSPKNSSLTML